ncbi:MAG: molybdenum cofactor biosynthesis protein MoaE [Actinomycetales bacterium]|nr:molybdenum cofactor biosynthesis protein MoaE [Tetrasphaera sp.]NLX00122.1 molybdenum cofactor biosynthesis protein MoaE [Actinomycetales bacterium]
MQNHPRVALVDVRDQPLSLDEVVAAVQRASHGAVVTFTGIVRDHDHGGEGESRDVLGLTYSAHPSALEKLHESCARVADAHPRVVVAAVHRTGELTIGDLAVVLAAASGHRAEAFAAARALIDDLKSTVPIWKHQAFADGTDEWVGLP